LRRVAGIGRQVAGIGLVLAVAAGFSGLAPARAETVEEFCTPGVFTKYEVPLAQLPAVQEPPESEHLPFGPPRVFFYTLADLGHRDSENVIVEGSPIGYELVLRGASYGDLRLRWQVESRLVPIDGAGRKIGVPKRRRQPVGLLKVPSEGAPARPRTLGFHTAPPGLYRYDLTLRSADGRLLGRYHDYYRVIPRISDVRLATFGDTFRAGDTVAVRVENRGTTGVGYGAGEEFDRLEPGGWVRVPFEELFGRPNIVPAIGLATGPGTWSDCRWNNFQVPSGMTPGRYRVVKWESPNGEGSAEFVVVP
jgi:Bacterial Ig-like domain